MKIFITGGTGFIGRHTIELLSKTNHHLNVLIRKTSNTSFINNENVTLVEGDLSEKHSLLKGMENCDAVWS